ncbi:MAG: uridine kinase [Candidatus Hydrogenedentes bacterium]|nr:uridine kinase [Candidatus Hydrogenedentota bacterium]
MEKRMPVIVAIAGPSCSGKTTTAMALVRAWTRGNAAILPIDAYYRDLSHLTPEERARINFDAPDAIEWELLEQDAALLARGESVDVPVYDFATHTRTRNTNRMDAPSLLVVEGLFALYAAALRDLCALRVFIDADDSRCLDRRVDRDVRERGRSQDSVVEQYARTVRPMAAQFILPTRQHADITLHGSDSVEQNVSVLLSRLES